MNRTKIDQKIEQGFFFSPQQLIKANILQLNSIMLETRLYQELESNPALEIVDNDSNTETDDRIINFLDFLDLWTKYEQESESSFEDLAAKPEPNDLLTLIYTSGTTGNPKGVMLSHGNMMSNVEGTKQDIYFDQTEIFLSFLPLSHSFERMGGHFTAFSVGAQVYYAESIETVPDNLREVKPSVVLSVPRLYEKMSA